MGALAQLTPEHYRPLVARPDDVFITCRAKSGTTFMQQMFHQIRMVAATGAGDMDFAEATCMTPWEDSAVIIDHDMNDPQKDAPRGFKSHREYERLPAGCRYVVTLRDPHETYVSLYRFFDGWVFERGAMRLEADGHAARRLSLGGAKPARDDRTAGAFLWCPARQGGDRTGGENDQPRFHVCAQGPVRGCVDVPDLRTEAGHSGRQRFDQGPGQGEQCKPGAPAIAQRIDAIWADRIAPVTGHGDFASLAGELAPW